MENLSEKWGKELRLENCVRHTFPTPADLNGVGDKIANCVALFSLDKTDAFPVDRHIARGLIQMGFSGSQKQAQDYFGKYAGYAGQLIFHHTRTTHHTRTNES